MGRGRRNRRLLLIIHDMRKLVITFTMLFAVISLMAQEHLSFKGIPIEGSMTAFCQKLKAKGFTSIGSENN